MNRGSASIDPTEKVVRKDIWQLGLAGSGLVTFQVQFGPYGGSYVHHCHSTVHENSAMLMRILLLNGTGKIDICEQRSSEEHRW